MLIDAKPPKPPGKIRRFLPLPVLLLLILVVMTVAGFLTYQFWNWREERAVSRFLTTIEQGNFQEAYQLWRPAPSYAYEDFLHDWGDQGDYGKIREFEILDSEARGKSVVITVRINNVNPPLELIVNPATMGLAYAPPDF
jgi:hypothetical protein